MKIYTSKKEGVFVEHIPLQLTDEDKAVLSGSDESAKETLKQTLASNSKKVASSTKTSELKKLYNSKKPKLKEGDVYELISVEIIDGKSGIMNYRLNGEHKQIRF